MKTQELIIKANSLIANVRHFSDCDREMAHAAEDDLHEFFIKEVATGKHPRRVLVPIAQGIVDLMELPFQRNCG